MAIHPNVFHALLEPLSLGGWQVVQEPGALVVRMVGNKVKDGTFVTAMTDKLRALGAIPPLLRVDEVSAIPKGASGKTRLVIGCPSVLGLEGNNHPRPGGA